ncbi:alkaline phosphatase D family protein [Spirillospora sp. NPDC050679]
MPGPSYGWVGGTTATAARFTVRTPDASRVRLRVSRKADLSAGTDTAPQPVDRRGLTKHEVTGLTASTAYHWAVEADGVLQAERGRFRTLPTPGQRADFAFCAAGDRDIDSDHVVYDKIREKDPLQFLFLGDLHYVDTDNADPAAYDALHARALSTPRYGRLIREVATVHTWDNHDFTGDFGWSGSPGARAVQESLRAHGTFYPLPSDGLYYTWVVGRCRFVMLDTRGRRTDPRGPDGASKSMLGEEQKRWFLDLLLRAPEPVVFVIESIPHRKISADDDRWGAYGAEFDEINAFVNAHGLGAKLVLISADRHIVAADRGVHSAIGAMELVAAPLDQKGGAGTGGYELGPISPPPGTGQFGHIAVTDAGDAITVRFTGHDHTGAVLGTLAKTFPAAGYTPDSGTGVSVRTADGWRPARVRAKARGGPEPLAPVRPWAWQGDIWS